MSTFTETSRRLAGAVVVLCLLLAGSEVGAQGHKTVIGPSNIDLAAGADLLKTGDAEEGIRRTEIGLRYAANARERTAGLSNLCAGYVMLEQPDVALPYCDEALEISPKHWRALTNRSLAYLRLGRFEECEADLVLAEELAPGSRTVKLVRSMYRDATDPVAPHVVVDDRRQPGNSADEK